MKIEKLNLFMDDLQAKGNLTFWTEDAIKALKKSPLAVSSSIMRLKQKGKVASPMRGFNIIVPEEYRALGCLPPEQFIPDLMKGLDLPYYGSLLTAAHFHGVTSQQPQEFQVALGENRKMINMGNMRIRFIRRQGVSKVPKDQIKTPRGYFLISSPEATALDLILYPDYSGGLGNVVQILGELQSKLSPEKLIEVLSAYPETAPAQRLGFIFDNVLGSKKLATALRKIVAQRPHGLIPLAPSVSCKGAIQHKKWNLLANVETSFEE